MASFAGGGAEKVGINLANYFSNFGYSVDLLLLKSYGPYRDQVSPNVNIIDLNVTKTRYAIFKLRTYLKSNPNIKIISVYRDTNIVLGLSAFGLKNNNLYFREASPLTYLTDNKSLERVLIKFIMRISYINASLIIANSNGTRDNLINHKVVKYYKCVVIGNPVIPINVEELGKERINNPWLNNDKIKVILNIGRLSKEKDQKTLISAFKLIHIKDTNTRLLIIGIGPEKVSLENHINDLGLNKKVNILDFVDNPYPFYRLSDIFVLSSIYEGFGNVLVESLSMGTPIVATNCPGGPSEILKNGKFGKLVNVGDSFEMAKAISKLLGEKKNDNTTYSKNFTVKTIGSKYKNAIFPETNI
jgi:glycosyltransferase involved in cell wall biosynthesis